MPWRPGIEAVRGTFADSINIGEGCFRLFREEQRAFGEVVLVSTEVSKPDGPGWECLGYANFVRSVEDEHMARWFRCLREYIGEISANPGNRDGRLRLIQRQLVDIIDILDPDARRVPSHLRKRLAALPS